MMVVVCAFFVFGCVCVLSVSCFLCVCLLCSVGGLFCTVVGLLYTVI